MAMNTGGSSGSTRQLEICLKDQAEFRRLYLSEPFHGGVLVSLREFIREGEVVELVFTFADSGWQQSIDGLVLWCRRIEEELHQAGVGFFASQAEKRERLLARSLTPAEIARSRQESRYPTTLKVTYQTATDFVADYTRNISAGGIFVDSRSAPEVGAEVRFRLYPPGQQEPIDLSGKVVWQRPGGGFGVRFARTSSTVRSKLDRLVRTLSVGAHAGSGSPVFEEINAG